MAITNGYCTLAELKAYLGIGAVYTATTISFASGTKKISDTAYGLEVFQTGDIITVTGSTSNNSTYNVATGGVPAEIVTTESLTTEVAGDTVVITVISDKQKDALLEPLVERASRAIDSQCGRRFYAKTATRRFESEALDDDGVSLWMDDDLLTISEDGLTNGDSDETAIADTEYWLIDRNETPYYAIRLKDSSDYSWEWDTDGWVSVTGTWGYASTTPAPIKQACIRWAGYMYAAKDAPVYETTAFPSAGVITVPKGIPVDVELLLDPYKRRVG